MIRIKIAKAKKYIKEQYDKVIKEMNLVQKKIMHEPVEDIEESEPEGDWSPFYYDRTNELEKHAINETQYQVELAKQWENKLCKKIDG